MLTKARKVLMAAGVGAAMLVAAPANAYYVISFYDGGAKVGETWFCESNQAIIANWGQQTANYVITHDYSYIC
jgi:hypothetical protein